MDISDRIYVAGHRGMVGSAICRALTAQGYTNQLTRTRAELDLLDGATVRAFFEAERPDHVFLAAAKVGGILANDTEGGDFIRENLLIQTHVIDAAYRAGVQKFAFLGSSCIYPKFAPQPISEDSLLTGALEPTNSAYAVAKIPGVGAATVKTGRQGKQLKLDLTTDEPEFVSWLEGNASKLITELHERWKRSGD